jgi:SAM-dependent methyltransferase
MTFFEWSYILGALGRHGYKAPAVDLGGVPYADLADYEGLSGTRGLVKPVTGDIWSCLGPVEVSHDAEGLASGDKAGTYATVISSSTLEHVRNPWTFFAAVAKLLAPGGLLVLATPFKWMIHGDPENDHWRFTEHGLLILTKDAGLDRLESGYHDFNDHSRVMTYVAAAKPPWRTREGLPIMRPALRTVQVY